MELLNFRKKLHKDDFSSRLIESYLDWRSFFDKKKIDFDLDSFFLGLSDVLEKNGVSLLVSIYDQKKRTLYIKFLNDAAEEKSLRKFFDYNFLGAEIKLDNNNPFYRPYGSRECSFLRDRQSDIVKTDQKAKKYLKNNFNSVICPFAVRGEVIGFFEFISGKIQKKHSDIFEKISEDLSRNISSSMLFLELKSSEEKFKDIFENADEGFYILNGRKKKFVETNKAMSEISGYTKQELLQMNYINLFAPEERKRIDYFVKSRLKNKKNADIPKAYETTILCKNGEKKDIKLSVSRFVSEEEWFVIINDITLKKSAEKSLKQAYENQAFLNAILNMSMEEKPLDEKIKMILNTIVKISWAEGQMSAGLWLLSEKKGENIQLYSSDNLFSRFNNVCNISDIENDGPGSVIINKSIEFYKGKRKVQVKNSQSVLEISSCHLPLMRGENVLGSVSFEFKKPRLINLSELEFFKAVNSALAGIIDREKNKVELEKSESKYRELIEKAGDMFVILSKDRSILFANKIFSEKVLKKDGAVYNDFSKAVDEKDREFFNKRLNFFLRGSKGGRLDFRSKDGLYFSANFRPLKKEGQEKTLQAIIRDVTESKLSEKKLFETKKHYLEVVDSIQDGIFVVDQKHRIVSYNKHFAEKVGIPVEKIKNKDCFSVVRGYEKNLFAEENLREDNLCNNFDLVFEEGKSISLERETNHKGKTYNYIISIFPSRNKSGALHQLVVTVRDISKIKDAEEKIRQLDEFKKRVLDNVPVSIVMLDRGGKISSMNRVAQSLLGNNYLGHKLNSTPDIKNNKELFSLYENLIKKGQSFKYTNLSYSINTSGEKRYLNIIAAPLFDKKGDTEGAISIAVDNTEPTVYREKIENLNKELERKVKKRTTELGRANKRLNRALELKSEFISDASHEIRTPLTIVKGNLDLLFLSPNEKNENLLDTYNDIGDEIERMSRIISDLTMLSNADSEMEKLHYENIDIGGLLDSVIKSLKIIADEKNIKLVFRRPARKVIIEGDEGKLDKLFINIVRNAIKYTDKNGEVKIKLKKEDGNILVSVKDDGIGIPEKDLSLIFERFYRVDKARSREEGGTGLGLSICKWIVESHGGEIKVKSKEGEGSEFIVKLPTKRPDLHF